jgi:hypothetical protein
MHEPLFDGEDEDKEERNGESATMSTDAYYGQD